MFEFLSAYWPHITVLFSVVVGVPAAIHAAMTKDDVRAAIGWVGVILLSPVLGAFLYLVAGINRIRQTAVSRRRARADARDGQGPGPRGHVDVVPWSAPQFASLKRLGDHVSVFPLAAGNRDYAARFGHVFLVCATGKSAAEMLVILRARLTNDPATELRVAAAEQMKITKIRLAKLVDERTVAGDVGR